MTRRIFFLGLFALVFLAARAWEQRPLEQPGGVLVETLPRQINEEGRTIPLDDFTLTVRARLEIEARVLGSRRYYLGRGSSLSPLDLALGWGPMSDSNVLRHLDISQGGRWYHFRYGPESPVDGDQLSLNSSNMHMIPAGSFQEKQLKSLRVGEIVKIRGLLVDVDTPSGWSWRTSLSRDDTGAGACEIVYVESVDLVTGGSES